MMRDGAITESCLSDHDWIGEFFLPGQEKNKFFGEVTFSPEEGVILSYYITGAPQLIKSELLYGVLNTGECCTLVGAFSTEQSSLNFSKNMIMFHGSYLFNFLVIGEHINEKEEFSNVLFSLTGMQEFFSSKQNVCQTEVLNKPLLSFETKNGQIEVVNNAKLKPIKDIASLLYSNNTDALNELEYKFKQIVDENPNSFFSFKEQISYAFRITPDTKCGIKDLYRHITDISNLFAIFTYRPVYPEWIEIKYDNNSRHINVYPTLRIGKRAFNLCKKELLHSDMPITQSNIKLSDVLKNWLKESEKYFAIVSGLQNETRFSDEHSVRGDLMIYIAQFESIYPEESKTRCRNVIETFATEEIKNSLEEVFRKVGVEDFAEGIRGIRNEIAHTKRREKTLLSLTLQDKVDIAQLLQVAILGYILEEIGVDKDVIKKYQNACTVSIYHALVQE